jgi:transposase
MDVRHELGAAGARSLPADALERIRHQAVAAVESGVSHSRVARLFGVSRKSVGNWVRLYRASGEPALRPGRRGRRAGEKLALSTDQQSWVVETVAGSLPDEVGLPYLLWTRKAVAELVRRELGVPLSPGTADRYLARWELVGPRRSPVERTASGLHVTWTHPRSPSGAKRLNALVGVTSRGVLLFLASEQPFTKAQLTEFHRRLRVQLGRQVQLLIGAWPEAHSEVLATWYP